MEVFPDGSRKMGPLTWNSRWPMANVSVFAGDGTWHVTLEPAYRQSTKISWFGEDFFLESWHYHSPSEMTIDGRGFDMEAQYLHRSAKGKALVMSVLFEVRLEPGGNAFLAQFWDDVPNPIAPPEHKYIFGPYSQGTTDALPEDRSFFAFNGSLSSPPCSVGVWWIVFQRPLSMNITQRDRFRQIIDQTQRAYLRYDAAYDPATGGQIRPWDSSLGMNNRLSQGELQSSQVVLGAMLAPSTTTTTPVPASPTLDPHLWVWLVAAALVLVLCGGFFVAAVALVSSRDDVEDIGAARGHSGTTLLSE